MIPDKYRSGRHIFPGVVSPWIQEKDLHCRQGYLISKERLSGQVRSSVLLEVFWIRSREERDIRTAARTNFTMLRMEKDSTKPSPLSSHSLPSRRSCKASDAKVQEKPYSKAGFRPTCKTNLTSRPKHCESGATKHDALSVILSSRLAVFPKELESGTPPVELGSRSG